MIKTIIFSISILLFFGCQKKITSKELALKNFEFDIENQLHDPSTYEFVEMSNFDTIYEGEDLRPIIKQTKENLSDEIYMRDHIIKRMDEIKDKEGSQIYMELKSNKEGRDNRIFVSESRLKYFKDSLAQFDTTKIASLRSKIKIRSNNKTGNLELNEYVCIFDNKLNILSIKKN